MAKLSEQLQTSQTSFDVGRLSRTQQRQYQGMLRASESENLQRQQQVQATKEKVKGMSETEYKNYYQTLPDWMKELFVSPTQIEEQRSVEVSQTKSQIQNKIISARDEFNKEQADYIKDMDWYRERIREAEKRKDSSKVKSLKQSREDRQDDFNLQQKYYNIYINKLETGIEMVTPATPYSFSDIENYADKFASGKKMEKELEYRNEKKQQQAYQNYLLNPETKDIASQYRSNWKNIDWTNKDVLTRLKYEQAIKVGGGSEFITGMTAGFKSKIKTVKNLSQGGTSDVTYWYDKSGKPKFQLIKTQSGKTTFRELGKGSLGTFNFQEQKISAPTVPRITAQAIVEEKSYTPLILQEEKPLEKKGIVEETGVPVKGQAGLGSITGITTLPTEGGKRKFKFESFNIFGVKVPYPTYKEEKKIEAEKKVEGATTVKSEAEISKEPKEEYDLTKYELYAKPAKEGKTQEFVYFPKEMPKELIGKDYSKVDKLAIDKETQSLKSFISTEALPKGATLVSPTTFEQVYSYEGKTYTAKELGKMGQEMEKKAPIYKKPLVYLSTFYSPSAYLGIRPALIKAQDILNLDKTSESVAKMDKYYEDKYSKDIFKTTGEGRKGLGEFLIKAPAVQVGVTTAIGYGIGGTLKQAGVFVPKGVTTFATTHPLITKTALYGVSGGLTALYGYNVYKQVKQIQKEGATWEEQAGLIGKSATLYGAGYTGAKLGYKYGLPLEYGRVRVEIPDLTKPIDIKTGTQPTRNIDLWKGVYAQVPAGHKTVPLFGKTTVPSEISAYGLPVGTAYKTSFGFGYPKQFTYPQEILQAGYTPSTQIETEFLKKYVAQYAPENLQRLLQTGLYVRTGTEYVAPKKAIGYEELEGLENAKYIPKEARKNLLEYFAKQKGSYFVYGSETVKAQIGEKAFSRGAHDVDVTFLESPALPKAQEIAQVLKAGGAKVQITAENQIMVKVKGEFVKLVDVHGFDTPDVVPQELYGFKWQEPVKVEGIKTMPIPQSATQKLAGTLTLRTQAPTVTKVLDYGAVEKAVTAKGFEQLPFKVPKETLFFSPEAPTAGKFEATLKHPADFYVISKWQIENLNPLKKLIAKETLSTQLESFKETAVGLYGTKGFEAFDMKLIGGQIISPPSKITPSPFISPVIIPVSKAIKPVNFLSQINKIERSVSIKSSVSPSVSVSPSLSISPSPSISPSVSISPSISPSPSVSVSPRPSRSPSPSMSPSPSISPSISPSPSVSPSPSISPSPSVSPSPSISPSPTISPSPFFPALPYYSGRGVSIIKRIKRIKTKAEKGYFPSFTSRVVDLAPIKVSEKEALKLINKIQTGFELRAPVILTRGFKEKVAKKIKQKRKKKVKSFTTEFKVPTFKVPTFKAPTFKVPTFKMPKLPKMSVI